MLGWRDTEFGGLKRWAKNWIENLELNRMLGGEAMTETMWRCDQVRAGQLYNRVIFNTREEAEEFMARMRQVEPDQAITVEAVDARKVWN